MSKPLISIITPVFNIIKEHRKDLLIENLKSVAQQSYPNIEHIVIDGGSSDGTCDLLDYYKRKGNIEYYSEPDKGLYDAMNKGVLKSKGDYILILNSDDKFINDDALVLCMDKIQSSQADFSYAKARCIDSRGMETPMPNCYAPDISHIFTEMSCSHQTILCNRKYFENNLFSLDLEIGSDYKWLLKVCMMGAIPVFLDAFIVEYHRGGKSDRLKNYHKYIDERVRTFYELFLEYGVDMTEYDAKAMFFEQYIGDKVWGCINKNINFNAERGYCEKKYDPAAFVESTWYVAAKNAMLLRLCSSYANTLIKGISLANVLIEKGYKSCAIYGYGSIGQIVYFDLIEHNYVPAYVIDKNYRGFMNKDSLECEVLTLDDELPEVDVIIVTPVFYYEEIKESLKCKVSCDIVALDDLVQE